MLCKFNIWLYKHIIILLFYNIYFREPFFARNYDLNMSSKHKIIKFSNKYVNEKILAGKKHLLGTYIGVNNWSINVIKLKRVNKLLDKTSADIIFAKASQPTKIVLQIN